MKTELTKKYGLLTAIAMVVGIVIGSGVFFKGQIVLNATGGNLTTGILAWVIVGIIMIICSYTFAIMATKYEYVNGVVDYAEVGVGKGYAYYVAWFMATIYYPTLTSVLAWVSARYTCVLFDWDITGGQCMVIACFYLIASYTINALSPIIAGKFQVSTTVIKLIPLVLVAIVGILVGFFGDKGTLVENFKAYPFNALSTEGSGALFKSIVAIAFAYEGWIIATSINAELKDSKKNLPRALILGSFIVVIIYIAYFIGLAGAANTAELAEKGAHVGFNNLFGAVGGRIITVVVVVSCLGTLNGLMLGCTRGIYALSARGVGPNPKTFSQVDPQTNMPNNASILGLFFAGAWLLYFYGANLTAPWFGNMFSFDSSELPIITLYFAYIPIFFMLMKKEKELSVAKRFIMPALSIISCAFMCYATWYTYRIKVVGYLIIFAVVMLIGALFSKKKSDI